MLGAFLKKISLLLCYSHAVHSTMISVKRNDKKNIYVHVLKWSYTLDTDEQHYHKSAQNISVCLKYKYKE